MHKQQHLTRSLYKNNASHIVIGVEQLHQVNSLNCFMMNGII